MECLNQDEISKLTGLLPCLLRAFPSQLLGMDILYQYGTIIYITKLPVTFSAKRAVKSEAQPSGMALRHCDDCVTWRASIFVLLKCGSDVSRIIAEDT